MTFGYTLSSAVTATGLPFSGPRTAVALHGKPVHRRPPLVPEDTCPYSEPVLRRVFISERTRARLGTICGRACAEQNDLLRAVKWVPW